jgi:hypothetical protein
MAEQKTTTEQIVRLAPFQEDYLADIFATAKGLTGDGSQMPYSAQQVAGLSGGQRAAIDSAMGGIGDYQGYLNAGTNALGQGIGAVGAGMGTIGNAIGQLPEAQQAYQDQATAAGLATQQGMAGLGQAQNMTAGAGFNYDPSSFNKGIGQAQNMTAGANYGFDVSPFQQDIGQAQNMTAGANYGFDPTSYQSYMDPYMNDVIQQQYQDIQRQGDIAKQGANAQAVGSGAFGGSRQGIQQAEINRNVLDQQARTGSQLRTAGFQQASNMAQQAAAQRAQQQLAQAGQYGQQAGQAGAMGEQAAARLAQQQLSQAGQYGQQVGQQGAMNQQLAAQRAQQQLAQAGQYGQQAGAAGQLGQAGAQQMGQVGQGLGNLAQLTGQLGSTTGALGQTIGQLGTATAGLGQMGQQMGVQDINTLLGIGGLQQQTSQQALDASRANELARQALPYQQVGFMSDIFRGVPALQQTYSTQSTPGPSTSSQILGLGIAGLGAAGAAGGIGNLFNSNTRATN